MTDWIKYKLDEVAIDIAMGPFGSNLKADNFISSGVPVIRGGNLNYGGFEDKNFVFVSEKKALSLKRSLAYPDDLVFTHRGTIGQVGIIPHNKHPYYLVSQSQMRLTVEKSLLLPIYLYYWFKSATGQYELLKNSAQVGVPSIASPTKSLKEIDITLPPLTTQTAIAEILSSLDDKIELNNQINRELEALAQALFKQWFVDFEFPDAEGVPYQSSGGEMVESGLGEIPLGWRVGTLSEFIKITGGGTPKRSNEEYWNGNIPWFSIQDAPNESQIIVVDTLEKISELGLNNSSTKLLQKGTTIITARGTVGKLAFVGEPMAMNQSCYGINGIGPYFNYFILKEAVTKLRQNTHGAVFDTITTSTFATIRIAYPGNNLALKFDGLVKEKFEYIEANVKENISLTTLRDTLLPKLISGEVQVSEL